MPDDKLAKMNTNPHHRKGTGASIDNFIVGKRHTVRTTLRAAFQVVLSP
jgi:hypothetical protein